MQKLNTVLLMIAVGLLVALWLKPEPRRYEIRSGLEPYIFDTATGKLVMLRESEEVKAHQAAQLQRKREQEAKDRAAHDEMLSQTCPGILAEKPVATTAREKRDLAALYDSAAKQARREECEEWQRSKAQGQVPVK